MQSVEAKFGGWSVVVNAQRWRRREDRFSLRLAFASMCSYRFAQFRIQGVLLGGYPNDHQFQICRSLIYKGVRFVKTKWHGIALMDLCRFVVDSNLTVPVEHVVDLFDAFVSMQSVGCSGGGIKR
jgi:hypothetical protein